MSTDITHANAYSKCLTFMIFKSIRNLWLQQAAVVSLIVAGALNAPELCYSATSACEADEDDIVLRERSVNGTAEFVACKTVMTEAFTVEANARIAIRAGERVVLGQGTRVQQGARLSVEVNPQRTEAQAIPQPHIRSLR